ncbi:MAG TPA: chromate transporter [Candidatus Lustribacter sp.]
MYHIGPPRLHGEGDVRACNGAMVIDPPLGKTPSLLDLLLGFMNIGLTSVGGAAGQLRHVIVKQRHWLSEEQLAEMYGVAQALPGATASNVAVMLSDRLCGPLGPLAALAGLIIPSLLLAIALAGIATRLAAADPRFAAAEIAVTAAVAGIFISNGIRLGALIWSGAPDLRAAWRCARIAISALGVLLVAGLHVFVPYAMLVLIALSMLVETRLHGVANEARP